MSKIHRLFGSIRERLRIHQLTEDQNPNTASFVAADIPIGGNDYVTKKIKVSNLPGGGGGGGSVNGNTFIDFYYPGYLVDETLFGFFHAVKDGTFAEISLSVFEPADVSDIKVDLVSLPGNIEQNILSSGTAPTLLQGVTSSHLSIDTPLPFSAGDEFSMKVKQTGNTSNPGGYLNVKLYIQ